KGAIESELGHGEVLDDSDVRDPRPRSYRILDGRVVLVAGADVDQLDLDLRMLVGELLDHRRQGVTPTPDEELTPLLKGVLELFLLDFAFWLVTASGQGQRSSGSQSDGGSADVVA